MAESIGMVLIVDDDASVRTSLGRLLRSFGFEAIEFSSAEDLIAAPPPRRERICAIIDIHMSGMNGLDLSKTLSVQAPWLPIVLITAFDDPALLKEIEAANSCALLRKPFDESVLVKAVLQGYSSTAAQHDG